jgi:uncharacterized membrane protein
MLQCGPANYIADGAADFFFADFFFATFLVAFLAAFFLAAFFVAFLAAFFAAFFLATVVPPSRETCSDRHRRWQTGLS